MFCFVLKCSFYSTASKCHILPKEQQTLWWITAEMKKNGLKNKNHGQFLSVRAFFPPLNRKQNLTLTYLVKFFQVRNKSPSVSCARWTCITLIKTILFFFSVKRAFKCHVNMFAVERLHHTWPWKRFVLAREQRNQMFCFPAQISYTLKSS